MDKVVVSVADDNLADLPTVVSALRDAGMVVDDVLETLGMVTGSVAPGVGDLLGAVPGVSRVEVDRTVRLPPDPGV
ncbi:hypothetical protein ALI22I_09320 [Saccharothrix sp. ALI-22-I]|uniref:hypothetical protein n=1 Tax=Saccharothrix sp. ALI-22-I TaxID=1933778 RepID=UPI00097CAA11|nr:hypothetical protein [Saccharothrix sp. ALI-22-I]ONI91261.1 hypothetical protein ALI22I_09320 [Saccharothrix sp. ALI-22-I]